AHRNRKNSTISATIPATTISTTSRTRTGGRPRLFMSGPRMISQNGYMRVQCSPPNLAALSPLPQRPLHRGRLALDHAQQDLRGALGRLAALLPVAQRPDGKPEAFREFRLREARLPADRRNVERLVNRKSRNMLAAHVGRRLFQVPQESCGRPCSSFAASPQRALRL